MASLAVMCQGEVGTWLTTLSDKNGEPLAGEDRLEAGPLTNPILAFLENDEGQVQRLQQHLSKPNQTFSFLSISLTG